MRVLWKIGSEPRTWSCACSVVLICFGSISSSRKQSKCGEPAEMRNLSGCRRWKIELIKRCPARSEEWGITAPTNKKKVVLRFLTAGLFLPLFTQFVKPFHPHITGCDGNWY